MRLFRIKCITQFMERADHTKEHMELTTWADAPEGKIKKSDVTVANDE